MKILTDFGKTVETGMDPRLESMLGRLLWKLTPNGRAESEEGSKQREG